MLPEKTCETTNLIQAGPTSSALEEKGRLVQGDASFPVKIAAISAVLYIILFSTAIYLKGHNSLAAGLLDWFRYFDPRTAFNSSGSDFTQSYLFNAVLYAIALSALFWLYYRAYRYCRRSPVKIQWLFGLATGLGLLLVLQPYMFSSDVYSYIIYGRIVTVYQQNPFRVPVENFSQDMVYPYLSWRSGFSIYGPVWTIWSAGVAAINSDNLSVQVLLFRLGALGFHLLTGVMVWKITSFKPAHQPAQPREAAVLLYLWNPLLLIEVGSGHNDFFMVFFLMLGLWLFATKSRLSGLALAMVAALIKLLIAPLILSFLVLRARQQPTWGRKIINFGLSGLVLVGLTALFYLPFQLDRFQNHPATSIVAVAALPGLDDPGIKNSSGSEPSAFDNLLSFVTSESSYLNSPATIVRATMRQALTVFIPDKDEANRIASIIVRLGLQLAFMLLLLRELLKTRDWFQLRLSLLKLTFYSAFLLYVWFWPWYLIPLVALAAINQWERWSKAAILFSFTIALFYCLFPLSFEDKGLAILINQWQPLLTFGIPLVYLIWQTWRPTGNSSKLAITR